MLDTGAIPNVMSLSLAKKFKLDIFPTARSIFVADGTSGSCEGVVMNVLVGFGVIVVRLKFLVMIKLPFYIIIGDPALVTMRAKMDRDHHTLRSKVSGVSETWNLEYKPEFGENAEDDVTSNTESEEYIGEDSSPSDVERLVLTLNETSSVCTALLEEDLVEEKVVHLSDDNASRIKKMFVEYADIIANSFDDVRPSKVDVLYNFDLTTD